MALYLSISSCIASQKSPAWDPGQHSSQDGEYSPIDSHTNTAWAENVKMPSPPPTPPFYAHFARAVINRNWSLMNSVSWSALKPAFPGTQQEDDQPFTDTDRSALKGVPKHWASAVLLLRLDRLETTLQGSHWFDLICSWPPVCHEWAPWRLSCCHANDPGTLNLRGVRAVVVMDEQFNCNLV